MSSFQVSNRTIESIVHYISMKVPSYRSFMPGIVHYTDEGATELGRAMQKLNIAAVNHRYSQTDFPPLDYKYSGKGMDDNKFQVLKNMQCWLYQCSEGEQFENDPLYKAVQSLADEITQSIVSAMPEYEAAQWGMK